MKTDKKFIIIALLLTLGVWCIVFQNAGIIKPFHTKELNVIVTNTPEVKLTDRVRVYGSVDVDNTVDVNLDETIDINLDKIVGFDLVTSKQGMYIGVNSNNNTVLPINWGKIAVDGIVEVEGKVKIEDKVKIEGEVEINNNILKPIPVELSR